MKKSAEEESNNDFDCNEYLHNILEQDGAVLFIDAMFLTHSDQDHCRGMVEYFNLCKPEELDNDKIRINELFVPARLLLEDEHRNDDADAIRDEANRRLDLYGTEEFNLDGNRLKIVGYSEELKDYNDIIIASGENIPDISEDGVEIFVLRPVKRDTDDQDAGVNDCTASFKLTFTINEEAFVAIIGGDITCENWKEVIKYNPDLEFDILLAPHHCSWHSVSTEDTKEGTADEEIEAFLEKSKNKAFVISSSKKIKRNDDNPPSYRAKNVYIKHLQDDERFICTAEYPDEDNPKPLVMKITSQGVSIKPSQSTVVKNSSYTPKSYGDNIYAK
ncbi:MAG: hypothetical protein ACLTA4_07310 [Clostridium sp.]